MTFEQIRKQFPALEEYIRYMPPELQERFVQRVFPARTIVHQKDSALTSFGIVCKGEHRVINEFENGNVFMIEKNEAISFLGEVTLLAGKETTSVTIETLTECTVLLLPIEDFHMWIAQDIHFLRLLSQKVALKLYHASYNRGERLFYSSGYLLLKYVLEYAAENGIEKHQRVIVKKTRQQLYEELGMTVKTLGRMVERLREDGLISLEKGKIAITRAQYETGRERAGIYMLQNRKGLL